MGSAETSRSTQRYSATSGKNLAQLRRDMLAHGDRRKRTRTRAEVGRFADVTRPLSRVRQICKRGSGRVGALVCTDYKSGAIQKRLPRPLRKDDTYKPRSVAKSLALVCTV